MQILHESDSSHSAYDAERERGCKINLVRCDVGTSLLLSSVRGDVRISSEPIAALRGHVAAAVWHGIKEGFAEAQAERQVAEKSVEQERMGFTLSSSRENRQRWGVLGARAFLTGCVAVKLRGPLALWTFALACNKVRR